MAHPFQIPKEIHTHTNFPKAIYLTLHTLWALSLGKFLISLWGEWVCFVACPGMPVIFHLWSSHSDKPKQE